MIFNFNVFHIHKKEILTLYILLHKKKNVSYIDILEVLLAYDHNQIGFTQA